MNKIFKFFKAFFKGIYKVVDRLIVTPISKVIYVINSKLKSNNGQVEKFLNKPYMLVYISLIFAVGIFFIVDSRVISLVQTEAEILVDQEVRVQYNKEKYVVEGIPDKVDITLIGRKSDLYLAKQLGDHEVILDLTDYEEGTYKVRLTLNQTIDTLNYKLDPSSVTVVIKQKVSAIKTITRDLLNQDKLDPKLSVKNVDLSKTEVVVKGSEEALAKVAAVKALVDLDNPTVFTGKGTYNVDNIPLVAYDSKGKVIDDVEIVNGTVTATIDLDSYSVEVPVRIMTTGDLKTGRAISRILINNKENFNVTIYGDKEVLDKTPYVEVTLDVSELGSQTKTFSNVTLTKPTGVRHISDTTANVVLEFGEESQRTISGISLKHANLNPNLKANVKNKEDATISVQIKGVKSIIDKIDDTSISAIVDLTNYGVGTHTLKVDVKGDDSRVTYVALKTVVIEIVAQ